MILASRAFPEEKTSGLASAASFARSFFLIVTIHNTFYKKNFNNYFNRTSYFENCNTSDWILLQNKNGLKEWLPWTQKFDENFYKKICSDILKKSL